MGKDDEIKSLNRENLNVEEMTPEELEEVSGGVEASCSGVFNCGDYDCAGGFSCTRTFGAEQA